MRHVVVTGCNRGIGLELCRQLVARGERVTAACRSASGPLGELDLRVVDGVDVTTEDGIARLKAAIGDERIDVLINNAGILRRDQLETVRTEDLLEQFRVNGIGPLQVTRALLGAFTEGTKVAIVTSRMGSIADNGSGGYYGYRMSKAAVNMAGMSLARDLESYGVAVAILHPGMVATDMTGGQGVDVGAAASGLLERIDELTLKTSGTFWHAEGEPLPW